MCTLHLSSSGTDLSSHGAHCPACSSRDDGLDCDQGQAFYETASAIFKSDFSFSRPPDTPKDGRSARDVERKQAQPVDGCLRWGPRAGEGGRGRSRGWRSSRLTQGPQHLIENEELTANSFDANGYTPMHAAASWNHPEMLRWLVSKGGNVNIQDHDGECVVRAGLEMTRPGPSVDSFFCTASTPLFVVEHLSMAQLLLELGADPHLHNQSNQTAAHALAEDHRDIAEHLAQLTGEQLPAVSASADGQETSAASSLSANPPPGELDSLDPASRQAAIETNQRAGALLERVQQILLEAEAAGEDPEERIRAVVDEAVRGTMEAGRRMAEQDVTEAGPDATQLQLESADDASAKRTRTEEPQR